MEVSHRPYASTHVLVGIDETSKQQVKETRAPLPGRAGQPCRYDDEYERNGVSNLCMIFAPLEGWRHVQVTERRTNVDVAQCLTDLVDMPCPQAHKIVLLSDNLTLQRHLFLMKWTRP